MDKDYTKAEIALLKRIGANIKKYRKDADLAQEVLAFESGLDRAYTGRVERGEMNISILKLKKLADALKIDVSKLLK